MGKRAIVIFFLAMATLIGAGSCRSTYGSKKQREVARTQEKRKKETMQQYEEAVKRHQSIQTKETRKRLKKHEREAKRRAKGRKKFFLFRWFSGDR